MICKKFTFEWTQLDKFRCLYGGFLFRENPIINNSRMSTTARMTLNTVSIPSIKTKRQTFFCFLPKRLSSRLMWLNSRRRTPRGPFTVTVRPFRDTVTAKKKRNWGCCFREMCEWFQTWSIFDTPLSGMSTVWLLRMVFILKRKRATLKTTGNVLAIPT